MAWEPHWIASKSSRRMCSPLCAVLRCATPMQTMQSICTSVGTKVRHVTTGLTASDNIWLRWSWLRLRHCAVTNKEYILVAIHATHVSMPGAINVKLACVTQRWHCAAFVPQCIDWPVFWNRSKASMPKLMNINEQLQCRKYGFNVFCFPFSHPRMGMSEVVLLLCKSLFANEVVRHNVSQHSTLSRHVILSEPWPESLGCKCCRATMPCATCQLWCSWLWRFWSAVSQLTSMLSPDALKVKAPIHNTRAQTFRKPFLQETVPEVLFNMIPLEHNPNENTHVSITYSNRSESRPWKFIAVHNIQLPSEGLCFSSIQAVSVCFWRFLPSYKGPWKNQNEFLGIPRASYQIIQRSVDALILLCAGAVRTRSWHQCFGHRQSLRWVLDQRKHILKRPTTTTTTKHTNYNKLLMALLFLCVRLCVCSMHVRWWIWLCPAK